MRDLRYDILFEPVRIGPVTAPNRFYQVPHCTGMGWIRPRMLAAMREVKAEGGWGVVCSEYCSIHPSSDDLPFPYASIWDEHDIKAHAVMTEAVHAHGSLAGVELWYGGERTGNLYSREVPLDLDSVPNAVGNPLQTRSMDKSDIRQFRQWHRDAAIRAKQAGFDVVYVYATHGYMLSRFLSPTHNTRTDEYGGSLENRVRLVRELIKDTKDAVGDTCAVAVRFSADEVEGRDGEPVIGERREMFEMLAELPDLWDINIQDYSREMGVSRFIKEGSLEPYMDWVKGATSKPVVTVGRFTSPDTMVSQVKRGVVDLIGAARPSIADPFLPKKIEEGRLEDIRECIGCNVCYSGDAKGIPFRCTQNPTLGEEWRRGWHPEKIAKSESKAKVLVVGAGPAGLEAARALGQRGYGVMLAEARRELGGRVTREAQLPGLAEWARVRDHRVQQLESMANVEIFRESLLTADDVSDVGADHVVVATGAKWRKERYNGMHYEAVGAGEGARLLTPDDIMNGETPTGSVVVYDEDQFYMASVAAERLARSGLSVHFATPADRVSPWSDNTAERWRVQQRLIELNVAITTAHRLKACDGDEALLTCIYTGKECRVAAQSVVMVTQRQPIDELYREIDSRIRSGQAGALKTVTKIGDCNAPSLIAAAVYAGHRYARELDCPTQDEVLARHDQVFYGVETQ